MPGSQLGLALSSRTGLALGCRFCESLRRALRFRLVLRWWKELTWSFWFPSCLAELQILRQPPADRQPLARPCSLDSNRTLLTGLDLVLLVSILSVWAPNFAPASGGPSALGSPLWFGIESDSSALILLPARALPGGVGGVGFLVAFWFTVCSGTGWALEVAIWTPASPVALWGGEGLDFAFLAMVN